jgi:hypothetical protein
VNLSIRPKDYQWSEPVRDQQGFLPDGRELARYIAHEFEYDQPIEAPPESASATAATVPPGESAATATVPAAIPQPKPAPRMDFDLMQISQVAEIDHGPIPLIQSLSRLFARSYPISDTHRFLARIPKLLADEPPAVRYQLVMTTNYDSLMEDAFREVGQDYDLIWYEAEGTSRGTFLHQAPGKAAVPVSSDYSYPFFESRPAVLKLHGTVVDRSAGSYVITEDNYIHYTARLDHRALPVTLTKR